MIKTLKALIKTPIETNNQESCTTNNNNKITKKATTSQTNQHQNWNNEQDHMSIAQRTTPTLKQGPKQQDCSINNNTNIETRGGGDKSTTEKNTTPEPKSKQHPTLFECCMNDNTRIEETTPLTRVSHE